MTEPTYEQSEALEGKPIEQLPGRPHDIACECEHCPEQPIDAQRLTKEIMESEAELRAMGCKPKSDCSPEQPNTELLIVKTIQGLISAANRELGKLDELTPLIDKRKVFIRQALDEMDTFQRTTLNELQKAFE